MQTLPQIPERAHLKSTRDRPSIPPTHPPKQIHSHTHGFNQATRLDSSGPIQARILDDVEPLGGMRAEQDDNSSGIPSRMDDSMVEMDTTVAETPSHQQA